MGSVREWARQQVETVREDPDARVALALKFYPPHLREFGRAEATFLRWEIDRGVMHPVSGSPWWQAVNDRLLMDKLEAGTEAAENETPSTGAVFWRDFLAAPSPRTWYRAHNRSVVSGYLDSEHLAAAEEESERFLMNVTLSRVLFTHLLAEQPRIAVGRFAPLGPRVADPRGRSVRVFLDLHNAFPMVYPLSRVPLAEILATEGRLARLIDYGLLLPKVTRLYRVSAELLAEPRLNTLLEDGLFRYADVRLTHAQLRPTVVSRAVARLTSSARAIPLTAEQPPRRPGE
ncbi:hypothetical protein AB0N05_10985 [Nocardia sp. NPDC051030]|uniref:hypothetical protein n=1 Tax=Nocardia sp. NPDC051030 TaxID=3155162 RepID=UPI003437B2C5